ncbi:putative phage associated-repressor [Eubacteriales bacterium]|nr:XRE family transcriptional regulator [Faecalicatena sp. BF-R-105]GKH49166.1 putative phage associated-repressor [Eubacteriales bacterium]GKH61807.1 putative phage associated-repressor [Eubacteriales bacterium]
MSLNERIKEARIAKGITQEQLGSLIGVAKTTVAGYEKNREPTAAKVGEIADVLGVDISFLFQDEVKVMRNSRATPEEMEKLVKKYRLLDTFGQEAVDRIIDVELKRCIYESNQGRGAEEIAREPRVLYLPEPLQKASAGRGALADDDSSEQIKVLHNSHTIKADYIMTVSGDSMEPEISDGERLLIREQPAVEDGELGIFLRGGERYVKRLLGGALVSANPAYPDIPLDEDSRCIGKVISVLDPSWVLE